MDLKNTTITLAQVANEAVGELLVLSHERGDAMAQMAAPIILDLIGQVAVAANGGEPVYGPEVGDLMTETAEKVAAWIKAGEEGTYPALADHPLGKLTLTVGDLSELIVNLVMISAGEALEKGDAMDGIFTAILAQDSTRQMLGSLVSSIRDEPVQKAEIDDLLSDAADKIAAELVEMGMPLPPGMVGKDDSDVLQGYA